jgi:hypothetical protein
MDMDDSLNSVLQNEEQGGLMSMMKEFAFAMPGIDEAMSFSQVMKYVILSLPSTIQRMSHKTSILTHSVLVSSLPTFWSSYLFLAT